MEERLKKAMEHANYAATLSVARKNLDLRYRSDLLFSVNGGTFTVTPQLMCFVDLVQRQNDSDSAVFVDDKGIPIRIDDLKQFADDISQVYYRASNSYHFEFEKLRKARNVKTIVEK